MSSRKPSAPSALNDHIAFPLPRLVFNADHSACQTLLPAVTSEDIEGIKSKGERAWTGEWCRYFSRQLMNAQVPLLSHLAFPLPRRSSGCS